MEELKADQGGHAPPRNGRLAWGIALMVLNGLLVLIVIVALDLFLAEIPLAWHAALVTAVVALGCFCGAGILTGIQQILAAIKRIPEQAVVEKGQVPRVSLVWSVVHLLLGTVFIAAPLLLLQQFGPLIAGSFVVVGVIVGVVLSGLAALFLISSVRVLARKLRGHAVPRALPGLTVMGTILLLMVPAMGLAYLFGSNVPCREFPSGYDHRVDLFVRGTGGYHTYRIPALVTALNGTLLAFCEGRKEGVGDHGNIDLVLKKSYDNGTTWSPLVVVHDDGGYTIGNPCPVVDEITGTIWLPFCRDNDRVFIMNSTDNGETWSTPWEITAAVKPEGWGWYATGPTHGIQIKTGTRAGRLVIPCDHVVSAKRYSHVFYSDDHGLSWELGGSAGPECDECTVVEASNGSLCLNMRSYAGQNQRAIAWSNDGGATWTAPVNDPNLIEPVCQGSLVRYSWPGAGSQNRVLFSNPANIKRQNMTVRLSVDDGETWAVAKVLYPGLAAYSDLGITRGANPYVCCLFEYGCGEIYEKIAFTRFTLEWLSR